MNLGYELRYRQVDRLSPEELATRLRRSCTRLGWQMGDLRKNGDGAVEVTGSQGARRIAIRVRPVQGAEKEVYIVCGDGLYGE